MIVLKNPEANKTPIISLADVGKRIKKLMRKRGLLQKDIASRMYVSEQTVSAWVKGETAVSLEKMAQLCNILDCDMDYLTGRIEKTRHDLQDICNMTGLSEEAARELQARHSLLADGSFLLIDQAALVNHFLTSGKAFSVCKLLQSALYAAEISDKRIPTPFIEDDLSAIRQLAESNGAVIIDSDIAIEYYFRIASDLFREILPDLIGYNSQ